MQRDDALEFVGDVLAPFGLAAREGLMLAVVGRRHVVDAGKERAEELAVVDDSPDRDAAEADAMIAALAPDEAGALALALHVPVGHGDLQRGVAGLGARIREEDMVEIGRRKLGDAARELEGVGMSELEGRREIERASLQGDRFGNLVAVMAGIAAPQARCRIEHGAVFRRIVIKVLGARDHARIALEIAVGGERHPERFEVVRSGSRQAVIGAGGFCHGGLRTELKPGCSAGGGGFLDAISK